jgi:endonuclease/exonuclease/phosphatase family metal-dependent hydrolase
MKPTIFILVLCICFLCGCQQSDVVKLKVMSYNIKHGEGMDTILDLSRSADIIKEVAPDLCALQEIDHNCLRSGQINQTDFLARRTGMKGEFGSFMDFSGGEYGMASLSAKPLIATTVLSLPDGLHEPRTVLIQEVEIAKACTIVFVNVHLDWVDSEEGVMSRLKQAQKLITVLDTIKMAVIITGDFNCTPNSPTMDLFVEKGFQFVDKGTDNLSYQGEKKEEIDHLIYRSTEKVNFNPVSVKLLEEPIASDHRPLVVELEVIF